MKNKKLPKLLAGLLITSNIFYFSPIYAQPVGLPSMGSASSVELSPLVEKTLGDAIMEQGRHDPTYISDLVVNQYLTDLGHKLAAKAPQPLEQNITVFAVRDPSINAFAMPGGYIGINSGLVTTSKTESELASVIAHEIGHVMQRHIARGLSQQSQSTSILVASLVGALLAGLAGQPDLAMGVATFGQAASIDRQLGFSRSAEQEADRAGLKMMSDAGFNPVGMMDMFKNLMRTANLNESIRNPYISSHPLSIQRLSDIENRLALFPKKAPDESAQFWFVRTRLAVLQARGNAEKQQLQQSLISRQNQDAGVQLAAVNYGLALLAADAGNNQQAIQYLDKALAITESASLDVLKIQVVAKSDLPAALNLASKAIQKWPANQAVYYEYGSVLLAAGKYDVNTEILKSAIQRWPDIADFQKLLANNYQKNGNKVLANETMAIYYELTGAYPTAVEHLEQARAQTDDFYIQSRVDMKIRQIRDKLKRQRELLEPFEG